MLRTLWSEPQPVSFRGRFHTFRDVYCEPVPVTTGGPPIWVGGHTDVALRRCARLGDGWHAIELPPEEFAAHSRRLDELVVAEGRQPNSVARTVATRLTLSGDDLEAACSTVQAYERAGCDHLVVMSTPSRTVTDNIRRAERLIGALREAALA